MQIAHKINRYTKKMKRKIENKIKRYTKKNVK